MSSEAANSNKAGIRYHGIKRGLIERGDSCYNRHESMVNEMSEQYYKPCRELQICNELIEKYFQTRQYQKCFEGHLALARQGYPLAECQVGYFYYDGLGTEKDLEKAVYWTRRAAHHGDRDGQYNLAWFYEDAMGVERDMEQAVFWYRKAALQDHDLAMEKCRELGIDPHASAVDPTPSAGTYDAEFIRSAPLCNISTRLSVPGIRANGSSQGTGIAALGKPRAVTSKRAKRLSNARSVSFLRKAVSGMPAFIPCATIGGSTPGTAQTEWSSLRWSARRFCMRKRRSFWQSFYRTINCIRLALPPVS